MYTRARRETILSLCLYLLFEVLHDIVVNPIRQDCHSVRRQQPMHWLRLIGVCSGLFEKGTIREDLQQVQSIKIRRGMRLNVTPMEPRSPSPSLSLSLSLSFSHTHTHTHTQDSLLHPRHRQIPKYLLALESYLQVEPCVHLRYASTRLIHERGLQRLRSELLQTRWLP